MARRVIGLACLVIVGSLLLSSCNKKDQVDVLQFESKQLIDHGIRITLLPKNWVNQEKMQVWVKLESTEHADIIHEDLKDISLFSSEETGPRTASQWLVETRSDYEVQGLLSFKLKQIPTSFDIIVFLPDELTFSWE